MGARPLPIGRLAAALYLRHEGRPAIVVGGGPSAPDQLEALDGVERAVILSANGHAVKLGLRPDYVVCKDHTHTELKQHMEHLLRPIGAPIVTRHYWGDYRLATWGIQGNSGMLALAVATLMGCRPIVPIGFDCYQQGTYFHDRNAKNVSQGIRDGQWVSRYRRLSQRLEGAPIRVPEDSFLKRVFPILGRNDLPIRPHMPVLLQAVAGHEECFVQAKRPFALRFDPRVEVPEGYVLPVDQHERVLLEREGCVALVDNPSLPMLKSASLATVAEGVNP